MERLIDAEKLIDDMKLRCKGNCRKCVHSTFLASDEHCGLIDSQPTAYDVDKVVQGITDIANRYCEAAKCEEKICIEDSERLCDHADIIGAIIYAVKEGGKP